MNIRPKRTRRPAEPGRHTHTAVRHAKADAEATATLGALQPQAGEDTMILTIPPALTSRAEQPHPDAARMQRDGARIRPFAAASHAMADPASLQRVADRLRDLPAAPGAYLRAIMPGGSQPWEPLNGAPVYAGLIEGADGRRYAGLYLGDEDQDGRIVIDATPAWLRGLRSVVDDALSALDAETGEALTALENGLQTEGRPAA